MSVVFRGSLRGRCKPLSFPDAHFTNMASCLVWMLPNAEKKKEKKRKRSSPHTPPPFLFSSVFAAPGIKPNVRLLSLTLLFLFADTPLLVRSSSDSALAPPQDRAPTPPPADYGTASPEPVSAVSKLTNWSPVTKLSVSVCVSANRRFNQSGEKTDEK